MNPGPFSPLTIGPREVPNRLVLAPVKTALGGTDGVASSRHTAYYRRRAEGGAGLIIVEPLFVDPMGREHPRQLGVHADAVVPGLRAIVDAVHDAGSIVFAHLNHAGRAANPKAIGGPPEAPSPVPCPSTGGEPREMPEDRISAVVEAYAAAAVRAKEAGFDGVELQLGLGYLPAQFLSPRTNLRKDSFSCEGENRWRFVTDLVKAVRSALGDGLALIARVSAEEKVEGGLGIEDVLELVRRVEALGVQGFHVVTGSACDTPPWYYQHMSLPPGVNEKLAARVHNVVSVPVIVAGRLGDPERIRKVIGEGMADAVALGRPLLADPDLPRKMREGRDQEIMLCGGCLQGCLAKVKGGGPIGCIVNPDVGREEEPIPAPEKAGALLVVVGGGPAGMQAAITARKVGYRVVLFEKEPRLGGLFNLAPLSVGKDPMHGPLESLKRAVERSGSEIRVGVEASVGEVLSLKPDRVVVATGSRPVIPEIPGVTDPLTAEDVLAEGRPVKGRVLVLGGGLVGIEAAEFLAGRGVDVVVVEMLDDIARDMEPVTRKMTLKRIAGLPVEIHTGTRLVRVEQGEGIVRSGESGEEKSLGRFDTVLVAVGHKPYDPLSEELCAAGVRVDVIGDAHVPGQVFDAVQAGRAVIAG